MDNTKMGNYMESTFFSLVEILGKLCKLGKLAN